VFKLLSGFQRHFLIVFILCCSCTSSFAQVSHKFRGVSLSLYDQKIGNTDLDKDYLYRSMAISISQKQRLFSLPIIAITAELQTQLGVTNVSEQRNSGVQIKGIETAILVGLNLELSLLPKYWWIYVGGSIGPQFISNTPQRQNDGFVFSDSVYAGSRIKAGIRSQLDLKAGFRHQSNAGISQPNGGINSLFISVGVLSLIKR
tara:strand:+ start:4870 stop:5478 length:609 start_codon:yes stop_codon:yes gene_type:complete